MSYPLWTVLVARAKGTLRWLLRVLELPAWAFALAACTSLPSRVAMALEQAAGIKQRLLYIGGGLLGDVGTVGPAVVVALVLLTWAARQRSRRAYVLGLVALIAFLVVSLVAQNAAAKFRFERGVLPGPIDAREGFGHHDFLTAEAPLVLAGRFLWLNMISAVLAGLMMKRLRTRIWTLASSSSSASPASSSSSIEASRASHHIGGLAIGCLSSFALLFASQKANAHYATLHNRDALASPAATLVSGLVHRGSYDGSPAESRRLLAGYTGTPSEIADGARNMGFAPDVATRLDACTPHPLARPLDSEAEGKASERGVEPPIIAAARALSNELFKGTTASGAPPIVFHVSLESMRADDIHGVEAQAPPQLAPFLSEVYSDNPSAAAFMHAHQSGVRTSHALSAVMCGMGALPFNISMSRDLGALPLRCMPDVLVDAGFRSRAFYGHEFVFDDMAAFLHAHHTSLHERNAFPANAPRGVWTGVSDASVYDAALDDAEATAQGSQGAERAEAAQYNFILTLSHHSPYTIPADLSREARAIIDDLCRSRGLNGENCDRLKTLRYSDEALGRFMARVESSKIASRAIVIVAGDHAVHQWVPWTERETSEGITQVPLFVWLPSAMRKGVADPAHFATAWNRFRALATQQPISNSDVPTLLLSILGQSSPIQSLSPDARWHTLGGQVTSPHYRSITGKGVAHGIDAHGNIFDVTESGATRPNWIPMETLRGPEDIESAAPHNRPEIALLGGFLRGYVAHCTHTKR